jgi:hypothetical protein
MPYEAIQSEDTKLGKKSWREKVGDMGKKSMESLKDFGKKVYDNKDVLAGAATALAYGGAMFHDYRGGSEQDKREMRNKALRATESDFWDSAKGRQMRDASEAAAKERMVKRGIQRGNR